ncbi:MAG: pseudouridine synthase [Chromatiales bacterium]|jgi:23S rRNA pseudouridine2605 synthase|nr:pseudouridine synthase [Chromatiales bacterium]
MSERIQKLLARLGYGSRRQLEEWIRAGRITIDGRPAQIGDSVSGEETITVDGRRVAMSALTAVPTCRVLMYNKPEGEICTHSDPEGRPSIFARLPSVAGLRWVAVGRLDINTSGLILLTTNGELANQLMHPSSEIEREYLVRVMGEVTPEILDSLRNGIELEDGPASFARVYEVGGSGVNHWYGVVLREGRKREVRRLWEAVGLKVSRLKRIRFGAISLPAHLRRGEFMELDAASIAALRGQPAQPAALVAANAETPGRSFRRVLGLRPKSASSSPRQRTFGTRAGAKPDAKLGARSDARAGARPGAKPQMKLRAKPRTKS